MLNRLVHRSSCLAFVLFSWFGPSINVDVAAATFTVTETGDAGDDNTADNLCSTALGGCTLRAAIQQANATAGPDTITFFIVGAISPNSLLPGITGPTAIDGSPAVVTLSGASAGGAANGLVFAAGSSNSSVHRLVVQNFSADGIVFESNSNALTLSFIGTDLASTPGLGNSGAGVTISGSGNVIRQNVISGNTLDGVRITGGSGNILDTNNLIGLNNIGTAALPNGGHGVSIQASTGNIIGPSNIISGNGGSGVVITGLAATGNEVKGNFIGTTLAGTSAIPNAVSGVVLQDTTGNTVGGIPIPAGIGNVISGNIGTGITISGGSGNSVFSNTIGADATGLSALANGSHGVLVENSPNNIIGMNGEISGNFISGNGGSGIQLTGSATTGTLVAGNTLGASSTGTAALPNALDGLTSNDASGTKIGGLVTSEDNAISGNGRHGIFITGGTGHLIEINEIGTDGPGTVAVGNSGSGIVLQDTTGATIFSSLMAANGQEGIRLVGGGGHTITACIIGLGFGGTVAFPNAGHGISIENSAGNIIGLPVFGQGNLVSGNAQAGIRISGTGSTSNIVQNTAIGINLTDDGAIPNGTWGVLIDGGASGNLVGGIQDLQGNVIRHNASGGVAVVTGTGNSIHRNMISSNSGLGVDLGADGVTANDPGDADVGANDRQNTPLITAATTSSVTGVLDSTPNTNFTIEIFRSAACDPSFFGEGETYLLPSTVDGMVTTDATGQAPFNLQTAGANPGMFLTATATGCSAGDIDLDLTDAGVINDIKTEKGCNSITAGGLFGGYSIVVGGSRTFQAPTIILTNGFEVDGGEFTADATAPSGSTSEFSACFPL